MNVQPLSSSPDDPVKFRVVGRHLVMAIDRPTARNAVSAEVAHLVESGLDRVEEEDELWTAVLTGTPPVFCSGADLRATRDGAGRSMFTRRGGFAGVTHRVRSKPLIAAVDGPALAGGTEIVLACDLVVATKRSSFGLPEVRRSLVASAGGLVRLPHKIPTNVAMECALTGEPLSAHRAHELGLVNILCPADVVGHALELADRIAANAPVAVRESRAIVEHEVADHEWAKCRAALKRVVATHDHREGLEAFLERRDPAWTGA